jgi:hypothetical protein
MVAEPPLPPIGPIEGAAHRPDCSACGLRLAAANGSEELCRRDGVGELYTKTQRAMPGEIIREVIIERRSLTCTYDKCTRFFSPHILGRDADGRECVIGFQYAGKRPGGPLPPEGEWCCFYLDQIDGLHVNPDRWTAGPLAGRPTEQVREVRVRA